jgi:autotransporter-associated beta strand protein
MNTNFSVGSLTFYSSAGNFSITNAAYTLTLTGGVTNDSANGQTINVPVSLSANLVINALVGNLTFGQNIANNGNTVTFAGGYNVTVNGAITGSAGLTQSGTGTLTLTGANNLTGTTVVSNGTVMVGGAANQSLGSTIMVKDGATLGVTASVATNYLSPGSLVVGSSSGASHHAYIERHHDDQHQRLSGFEQQLPVVHWLYLRNLDVGFATSDFGWQTDGDRLNGLLYGDQLAGLCASQRAAHAGGFRPDEGQGAGWRASVDRQLQYSHQQLVCTGQLHADSDANAATRQWRRCLLGF